VKEMRRHSAKNASAANSQPAGLPSKPSRRPAEAARWAPSGSRECVGATVNLYSTRKP